MPEESIVRLAPRAFAILIREVQQRSLARCTFTDPRDYAE